MNLAATLLLGTACLSFSPLYAQAAENELLRLAQETSLAALPDAPADPSNRFWNDADAIALGESLFFDPGLSKDGTVACASCHVTEGEIRPNESIRADQNRQFRTVMPIIGAQYQSFFFWDGRADSLWSQALGPLENDFEHDLTRSEVASYIAASYRDSPVFADVDFDVIADVPAASPMGSRAERLAWKALPENVKFTINQVFVQVGKSIAAFEASLPVPTADWDVWLAPGTLDQVPDDVLLGFEVFAGKGRCITCHAGPLFTDFDFHNTGLPAVQGFLPDVGRQSGSLALLSDPFNCLGEYSDAAPEDCLELRYMSLAMERNLGAFRTPSLRGVSKRERLGHAGQMANLREMVEHYNAAPAGPHGRMVGQGSLSEIVPLGLSEMEMNALVKFLEAL